MKTHLENGEQWITLVNPAGWKLLGFVREADCLHKSPKMYQNVPDAETLDGVRKEQI